MQPGSLLTTTSLVPLRLSPRYIKKTLGILSLAGGLTLANFVETQAVFPGAEVVAGSGGSEIVGQKQTITQTSVRGIVVAPNGGGVNVGETLHFNHTLSNASTVFRIIDANPTQILGAITGNSSTAKIYMINANGFVFGAGSSVNVGSLIASTADISNEDFMAGKTHFNIASANLNAMIKIENGANITVADAGFAAFLAPAVHNHGVINAKAGRVALVAGQTAVLDFYGDGLINIKVTKEVEQVPVDSDTGAEVNALIDNTGDIIADGGTVVLTAEAAKGIIDNVINLDGTVQAQTVEKHGEVIVFGGQEGTIELGGTIDVSGKNPGEKGGVVHVLSSDKIHIKGTTQIDASGDAGGGTILVGGEFQGSKFDPKGENVVIASKNPDKTSFGQETNIHYIKDDTHHSITNDSTIPFTGDILQAKEVTIDAGAQFKVNATNNGDGGKAIFWSPGTMNFTHARIDASAGPEGGDGGFIEISGKEVWNVLLDAAEKPLSTLSLKGKDGMTVFDPDGTIGAAEAAALVATLAGGNATFSVTGLLTVAADIITVTTNTLFFESRAVVMDSGIDINLGPDGSFRSDINIPTSDPGVAFFAMVNSTCTITAGGGITIQEGAGNGGTTSGTSSMPGTFSGGVGGILMNLRGAIDAFGASLSGTNINITTPATILGGVTFTGTNVNLVTDNALFGATSPTFPNLTTAPFTSGGTAVLSGTGDALVDGTCTAAGNTSCSFDSLAVTGPKIVPAGITLTITTPDFDSDSGGMNVNGTLNITTGTFFPPAFITGGSDAFIGITATTINTEGTFAIAQASGYQGTMCINGDCRSFAVSSAGVALAQRSALDVAINSALNQVQNAGWTWLVANNDNSNNALANLAIVPRLTPGLRVSLDRNNLVSLVAIQEGTYSVPFLGQQPESFTQGLRAVWLNTQPGNEASNFAWSTELTDNIISRISRVQSGQALSDLNDFGFTPVPISRDQPFIFGQFGSPVRTSETTGIFAPQSDIELQGIVFQPRQGPQLISPSQVATTLPANLPEDSVPMRVSETGQVVTVDQPAAGEVLRVPSTPLTSLSPLQEVLVDVLNGATPTNTLDRFSTPFNSENIERARRLIQEGQASIVQSGPFVTVVSTTGSIIFTESDLRNPGQPEDISQTPGSTLPVQIGTVPVEESEIILPPQAGPGSPPTNTEEFVEVEVFGGQRIFVRKDQLIEQNIEDLGIPSTPLTSLSPLQKVLVGVLNGATPTNTLDRFSTPFNSENIERARRLIQEGQASIVQSGTSIIVISTSEDVLFTESSLIGSPQSEGTSSQQALGTIFTPPIRNNRQIAEDYLIRLQQKFTSDTKENVIINLPNLPPLNLGDTEDAIGFIIDHIDSNGRVPELDRLLEIPGQGLPPSRLRQPTTTTSQPTPDDRKIGLEPISSISTQDFTTTGSSSFTPGQSEITFGETSSPRGFVLIEAESLASVLRGKLTLQAFETSFNISLDSNTIQRASSLIQRGEAQIKIDQDALGYFVTVVSPEGSILFSQNDLISGAQVPFSRGQRFLYDSQGRILQMGIEYRY